MEQLKTETFGKLKELGNSILGIIHSLTYLLIRLLTLSIQVTSAYPWIILKCSRTQLREAGVSIWGTND